MCWFDCFSEEVEFRSNWSCSWGHSDFLSQRGAFQNPQMAAVLPEPIRGRRAIGKWGASVEELVRKDTE